MLSSDEKINNQHTQVVNASRSNFRKATRQQSIT